MKLNILFLTASIIGNLFAPSYLAHASGNENRYCYELRMESQWMKAAKKTEIPQQFCLDDLHVVFGGGTKVFIQFESNDLPTEVAGSMNDSQPFGNRTVRATVLRKTLDQGVCQYTADALLSVTAEVTSDGILASEPKFSGIISETDDNCHLTGDSAELNYVRVL